MTDNLVPRTLIEGLLTRVSIAAVTLVALGVVSRAAIGAPPALVKHHTLEQFVGEIEKNQTVRFYMPTFTGRWICVPIFSKRTDLAANHEPTVLGVVAVDTQSDHSPLQFRFPQGLQPHLYGGWDLSILTPDRICIFGHNPNAAEAKEPVRLWIMALSNQSVMESLVTVEDADRICRKEMRMDPLAFAAPGDIEQARPPERSHSDQALAGVSGWGQVPYRGIRLNKLEDEVRFLAPGSAPDRQLECRISPTRAFRISEVERRSPERPRWSFSQNDFDTDVSKAQPITFLYFPCILTAPVTDLFFVAERDDESSTLFRIAQGRKQRCWDLSEGYEVNSFHQSPNEEYASLRISQREDFTVSKLIHVAMRTSGITVFDEPVNDDAEKFALHGVNDQGELILQSERTLGVHQGRVTTERKLEIKMLLPLGGRFALPE